jgi:hypothetical protein
MSEACRPSLRRLGRVLQQRPPNRAAGTKTLVGNYAFRSGQSDFPTLLLVTLSVPLWNLFVAYEL